MFLYVALSFSLGLWLYGIYGSLCLIYGRMPIGLTWFAVRYQTEQTEAYLEERRRKQLEKQMRAEEKHRNKLIKKEAKLIKQVVSATLTRAGLARLEETKGIIKTYSKIKFDAVVLTDDVIWLKVNARKMPFKITLDMVDRPEVLANLTAALEREVFFDRTTNYGFWVAVGLASGVGGIPKAFPYASDTTLFNAVELTPKTVPLTVPVGVTSGRKFVYAKLPDMIHALVAGTTGSGKSVFMNVALTHLIQHNSPSALKIFLIDLKGGLEFSIYENIPHLGRPLVFEKDEVAGLLQSFFAEKERRFKLLRDKKLKDFKAWNATQTSKMPFWLLVFDEIQAIMLTKKLRTEVDTLLRDLSEQGRAVGLSVWVCTQFPNKEILSTSIKINTPTKMCFSTSNTGSISVLGNGAAAKLNTKGRAIFAMPGRNGIEVQAPYLGRMVGGELDKKAEEAMILAAIATAKERWARPEIGKLDIMTALDVIIHDYDGKPRAEVVRELMGVSKETCIAALKELDYNGKDGPLLELANGNFYMFNHGRGIGRELVRVGSMDDMAGLPNSYASVEELETAPSSQILGDEIDDDGNNSE